MQQAAPFWDKVAERYARMPIADMDSYNRTLDRTRSHLRATDEVLELGCGTGGTALLLAPSVGRITASDLSPEMIRIGRDKARDQGVDNVGFVTGDVFGEAIGPGPYDAVLAHNLLHLLPDPQATAARVASLLKPGGLFISKTPTLPAKGSGWGLKLRLMMLIVPAMQALGKAPFVNIRRVDQLEQSMRNAGFEIVESASYPAGSRSRYIVARRR